MQRRRLVALIAGVFLLGYVVSFGWLAAGGGYLLMPSGESREFIGLATADTWVWQPRQGVFHVYLNASGKKDVIADGWGRFYSPLVLAWQGTVAKSRPAFAEGKANVPRLAQLHPEMLEGLNEEERAWLSEKAGF